MRITTGLHLVFSGSGGFDLTDRYDCHAWLFDTGAGWALVDSGAGRDPDAADAAIANSGVDPGEVRWLLLTHAHADHSGGAASLRQRLGLKILAGAATAALLRAGDPAAIGLQRAIACGVYPADYRWSGAAVDRELQDGEAIALGRAEVAALATPGHCADHVCYRVTLDGAALLFAGDALFWGGRVVWQDLPDCNVAATCASVRRLATEKFDALLPGHGAFSLRDGQRHAARALCRIERLLAPEALD